MIRALSYILQVTALAAFTLWVIAQPGLTTFEWLGYTVTAPTALLVLCVLLLIVFWTLFLRLMDAIISVPRSIRKVISDHRQAKGYQALTRSLVAMASSNPKLAYQYAQRARKLLPVSLPITDFLLGYAAKAEGRESEAFASYERLLTNKDSAYLGLRGMIQSAIDRKEYSKALQIARQALAVHKHNPTLYKAVYDLEIKTKDYRAAQKTLHLCAKGGAISVGQEESDALALWLLRADEDKASGQIQEYWDKLKQAAKIDPAFTPLVIRQMDYLLENDQRRKAQSILEQAWSENAHPDLEVYWSRLAPQNKPNDTTIRLKFFEKLKEFSPRSAQSYLAIAQAALDDNFFGEARRALLEAEKIMPSTRVYRMLAKLEEKSSRDTVMAQRWLEKAAEVKSDPLWYCRETGLIYNVWAPIAQPHGAFNTIIWGQPSVVLEGTSSYGQQELLAAQ